MLIALIMAGVFAASTPQDTRRAEPTEPAPTTTAAPRSANARTAGAVCEVRPMTGSRLNQRLCRSRGQAARDRDNAQDMAANAQVVLSPSEQMILNGGPR